MTTTTVTPVLDAVKVPARHGGLVEVRLLHTPKGTVSGYFTDPAALVQAVRPWDGRDTISITLNPVRSDLLARRGQVSALIDVLMQRARGHRATYKQTRTLVRHGFDPDMFVAAASAIITSLAANGWRRAAATVGV
jgi:hypothetical protein